MSLQKVEMFRLTCERCGEGVTDDEYWAWADENTPFEFANESDWLIREDGHWCPECTTWDEEGDERIPRGSAQREQSP